MQGIQLTNCKSLPPVVPPTPEADKNLQTQLRSQFYIFKKFVQTISKIDNHFKASFNKNTSQTAKTIIPDSFYAFRDRFLFDFQHSMINFIDSEISKLTQSLNQVTQKLIEKNGSEDGNRLNMTQSKAQILSSDISGIVKDCEEQLKDCLLKNYDDENGLKTEGDGDILKQIEEFSSYLGVDMNKVVGDLVSEQILRNPPNSNFVSEESLNLKNAGGVFKKSLQSFNLVSQQGGGGLLQNSIDMSVTLQYSQLSPNNTNLSPGTDLLQMSKITQVQEKYERTRTPQSKKRLSNFDDHELMPTSLENTENTKNQSFIMMESNPLMAFGESQISQNVSSNEAKYHKDIIRQQIEAVKQFSIGERNYDQKENYAQNGDQKFIKSGKVYNQNGQDQMREMKQSIPAAHEHQGNTKHLDFDPSRSKQNIITKN